MIKVFKDFLHVEYLFPRRNITIIFHFKIFSLYLKSDAEYINGVSSPHFITIIYQILFFNSCAIWRKIWYNKGLRNGQILISQSCPEMFGHVWHHIVHTGQQASTVLFNFFFYLHWMFKTDNNSNYSLLALLIPLQYQTYPSWFESDVWYPEKSFRNTGYNCFLSIVKQRNHTDIAFLLSCRTDLVDMPGRIVTYRTEYVCCPDDTECKNGEYLNICFSSVLDFNIWYGQNVYKFVTLL